MQAERNTLVRVRRLASFVAIFILLSTAAPLLACMTGRTMNHEESACCRSMHGNCGDMAKMGCCKTEVKTDESPQLATVAPATNVHFAVIAWLTPLLPHLQTIPPSLFSITRRAFPARAVDCSNFRSPHLIRS